MIAFTPQDLTTITYCVLAGAIIVPVLIFYFFR